MAWTLLSEVSTESQAVASFDEVKLAADQAAHHARVTHGWPTLIELSLDSESTMAIVVGGDWSYAAFLYAPHGPAFYSHGREALAIGNASPLICMQFGSQSEIDQTCVISLQRAWEALRQYFQTKKQPDTIDWR